MKLWIVVLVLVGAMVLAACGGTDTTQESPLSPGIANPASQYCEEQGYKVEIRTAADGSQAGYCIFDDGTECEEWAFQRGECKPGTPKP
jgi:inhibitor of cysteine peptidase